MPKAYDVSKLLTEYMDARSERSEWEAEAKTISDYIVPGRGIYQLTKPRKRRLTSSQVINPRAKDALQVLTSGMQAGLTSPSRPWFSLKFSNPKLNAVPFLKQWLYDCEKTMYTALAESNFYQVVHSFYTEYAAFGTASMYVGEDSKAPFRFELLTFGEFAFFVDATHRPSRFYRTIFMTPAQMIEKFGLAAVSTAVQSLYKEKSPKLNSSYVTVIQAIINEPLTKEKAWTSIFFEIAGNAEDQRSLQKPLKVSGYHEFPYPLARWEVIGSDIYGVGPGATAIPDTKRLQEMEKAFLKAIHKEVDPPLQAPSRMKNRINSLPGAISYNSGPNEKVERLYEGRFDYPGASQAIERVEQRIDKCFFNDIFLTSARDPNASPMKAKEVEVKEKENTIRLGPVVERLYYEFFQPVIERCFNILARKEMLPPAPPDLAALGEGYEVILISPLAQAQKMMAATGIQSFLSFVGQAAQFSQEVLDKVDVDKAVDEYHDISGAPASILRDEKAVVQIRQQRQQMILDEKKKQEAAAAAQIAPQAAATDAQATKTMAEAGAIGAETFMNQL